MASSSMIPGLAATILAAAGLGLALLAGAPLEAALIAGFSGTGAALLLRKPAERDPLPLKAEEQPQSLPQATELMSAIGEPLLLIRERRVIFANDAARKLLGGHIEGVDVRLAIRHPAAAERLARQEEEDTTSTELAGLGQADRRWMMTVSNIGAGTRLVHLSDRSESHASEQMRTDFVANASHELRTPLATLLGFLETLQDDEAAGDPKTRERFLGIMFDEARRMHRLVDDLISLSRIEAERFSLPSEAVELLPLVEEVRAGCARLFEAKESSLVVEFEGPEPVVPGDRSQLLQLLQNLVVNALKYGRSATPVTIRFEPAGRDMLRLSVIDRGEGIAPEHLPRLTERFYRVDAGRSRSMGGTGLGLAIVKHIVGRHRGRLDIQSKVGEGTAVHIYLPRAQPADVIKESRERHTSHAASP
jgi:two-component system phosphate regulon sensor histidine kinase PhoR